MIEAKYNENDIASADDDVIKFIEVTGIHPLLVTVFTAVMTVGFIGIILKRKYTGVKRQLFCEAYLEWCEEAKHYLEQRER